MGVFLRDPSPYLREFRRKTTENSEWLGRQARPGFEPGTSRLPVSSVTTLPLVGHSNNERTRYVYDGGELFFFFSLVLGATITFCRTINTGITLENDLQSISSILSGWQFNRRFFVL